MDYVSVLKLNKNFTIIDAINNYKVLVDLTKKDIKLGESSLDQLNELNMAFIMACTKKSPNELANLKNEYIRQSKTLETINEIKKLKKTFKAKSNNGLGVCFDILDELFNFYLINFMSFINYINVSTTKDDFFGTIIEFNNFNWPLYFYKELKTFFDKNLMPGLLETKETQMFLQGLSQINDNLELIHYLEQNISYFIQLELANEKLMNSILYHNSIFSNLPNEEAMMAGDWVKTAMKGLTRSQSLSIEDLIIQCESGNLKQIDEKIVKTLGLHEKSGPSLK